MKFTSILIVLILLSGCSHLQQLRSDLTVVQWDEDRRAECKELSSSEGAWYPGAPTFYEKVGGTQKGWKVRQSVHPHKGYFCICSQVIPKMVADLAKVAWKDVRKDCRPLGLRPE